MTQKGNLAARKSTNEQLLHTVFGRESQACNLKWKSHWKLRDFLSFCVFLCLGNFRYTSSLAFTFTRMWCQCISCSILCDMLLKASWYSLYWALKHLWEGLRGLADHSMHALWYNNEKCTVLLLLIYQLVEITGCLHTNLSDNVAHSRYILSTWRKTIKL